MARSCVLFVGIRLPLFSPVLILQSDNIGVFEVTESDFQTAGFSRSRPYPVLFFCELKKLAAVCCLNDFVAAFEKLKDSNDWDTQAGEKRLGLGAHFQGEQG